MKKEKPEKLNELKDLLNKYPDLNEHNEVVIDLGNGEIEYERIWDYYDCSMGYSELVSECVMFTKQINEIKKMVKEIC